VLEPYELLNGGFVNLSYKLRLEGTEAPPVLRIYTRDPSACEKEIRLRSLVKQIPVAPVIYSNPHGDGR
jgi:hypothetical protein